MKILTVLSVVLLALAIPAFALDVLTIGAPEVPIEFENWSAYELYENLELQDCPCGRAILAYVKNTSTRPWVSFHFKIFSRGQDISCVGFIGASMGGVDPTSSQSGLTWTIDPTTPDEGRINLYFYDDPVMPGQSAWFQVYEYYNYIGSVKLTYGIAIQPAHLPEPSNFIALTSLLGIAGLVCRKRV